MSVEINFQSQTSNKLEQNSQATNSSEINTNQDRTRLSSSITDTKKQIQIKSPTVTNNPQQQNGNCPPQKPDSSQDKAKLEAAKKEKEALYKELEKNNQLPFNSIKELSKLKQTFKVLDNNIQAKINNKGYSSDIGEFINLRAETQKNISDIERTTLKVEMQFLRS